MAKGTHRAVVRFHRFQKTSRYLLKCDIEKYFPSIDHAILKELLRRKIKCPPTLRLCDLIIERSCPQVDRSLYFPGDDLFAPFERTRGLPIGNLTSQFWANVYLDPMDHYVKETLRPSGYLRYMDDFVIFADTKAELWHTRDHLARFLESLRLRLKPAATRVYDSRETISFLGYRLSPTHRRISRRTVLRARASLSSAYAQLRSRIVDPAYFCTRLMSFLGQAKWANAKTVSAHLLESVQGVG